MEFEKQNEVGKGEEHLRVFLENGYVVIHSEKEETHSYWLNKDELDDLILTLEHLQDEVYRKG